MSKSSRPRVVATGLGLVSSLGNSMEEVAQSLRMGTTGFVASPHPNHPGCQPVCHSVCHSFCHSFCPVAHPGNDACLARLNAWSHKRYLSRAGFLAVLAGLRAMSDAGLEADGRDGYDVARDMDLVATAAPMLDFEREPGIADESLLDALWILRWLPNTPVSALARFLGIHGEGLSVNAACASGLAALGEGFERVTSGRARRVLVVAADSRLSRGALMGYARARVLSTNPIPEEASRPFDADRDGFVPGEGGAAFVLESLEDARRRGARVLFEVAGYGASMDAESLTAPRADGFFALEAAKRALVRAELEPSDVSFVSAHGTGTSLNDEAEANELLALFGTSANMPPVTAIKSWIGHGASACGALELAVATSALREGFLPFVRNLDNPAFELPFVRRHGGRTAVPAAAQGRCIGLFQSFGFGGHNAVLVVRMGDSL